jgi:hypothetical protein
MEIDRIQDLDVDGRIIRKVDCEEVEWGTRSGMIWLRIGTGGGQL